MGPYLLSRPELLAVAVDGSIKETKEREEESQKVKARKKQAGSGGGDCPMCGALYKHFFEYCGTCGHKLVREVHFESREEREAREERERPPPALPREFSNVLRAEVVCRDEEAFESTVRLLLEPPPPAPNLGRRREVASARALTRKMSDDSSIASSDDRFNKQLQQATAKFLVPPDQIEFRAVKVLSDHHGKRRETVFPRCASVLITLVLGEYPRKGIDTGPRQLVEVEVVFPWTKDARWLTETCGVDTADAPRRPKLKRKRPRLKRTQTSGEALKIDIDASRIDLGRDFNSASPTSANLSSPNDSPRSP
jgi:hypothetical protein